MRFAGASQISFDDLKGKSFDGILVASGYERRATNIAARISSGKSGKLLALGFKDRRVLSRPQNDGKFKDLGYKIIPASGGDGMEISGLLNEIVSASSSAKPSILIDYSCMTRTWYAKILDLFRKSTFDCDDIDLYFAYSCSSFTPPPAAMPNEFMGPIPGFETLSLPDKELALVIGLGYEEERALGLSEYVDAAETFAFYSEPALVQAFSKTVKRNNRKLITNIGHAKLFAYPLADMERTSHLLASLCGGLMRNRRIILAPLGPKPFSLVCLIYAVANPDIEVWRVTSGQRAEPIDRKAWRKILVTEVKFTSELCALK